jgi:transcriptional regulator with XRE-family HTH domain
MDSIGQQLRTRRQAHGLSQAALAAKARVSRIYVEKIEAGARTPSWGTLGRLARALGCRVELRLVSRRGGA